MFTGIITDIGIITHVEERGDLRVTVQTGYDTAGIAIGASVANSGVCLTVVDKAPGRFSVDVSGETQRRTAGEATKGERQQRLEPLRPQQRGRRRSGGSPPRSSSGVSCRPSCGEWRVKTCA